MNACQISTHSVWVDLAVFLTALGALVFVVLYAVTTRWNRTEMGRHVMIFMVSILVVTMLAVLSIFLGTDWPHREVIRGAAWAVIAACIWWRVAILVRAQHLIGWRRNRNGATK